MKQGFYLYGILLLGVVYDYIEKKEAIWYPPDGVRNFFIIRSSTMHLSSMVYYTQELLTYLALIFYGIIFKEGKNSFFWLFVILTVINLIDFWMTGNTAWFMFFDMAVTYNIVQVFTFTLLLANESIKHITSSSRDPRNA